MVTKNNCYKCKNGGGRCFILEHAFPQNSSIIFHGSPVDKWYSVYLHLNKFATGLSEGDTVVQGQLLGEMGSTGNGTVKIRVNIQCIIDYYEFH